MQRQSAYGIALFTCRPNSTTEALYTLFGWEFPKGGPPPFSQKFPNCLKRIFQKSDRRLLVGRCLPSTFGAKYLKKAWGCGSRFFCHEQQGLCNCRASVRLSICPMRLPHDAVVGTVCCCSPPAGSGYRLLQQRRAVTRCHRG